MSHVTGVASTKQFNHSSLGIVRCPRWRRVIAPLLICAMGIGKGKLGSAQANRNRFPLCYAGKPISTKSSGGDSASTKCVPYGSGKRRTALRRCAQSYQHNCAVRAKARVQRTVPLRPHLQNLDLVIAQLEYSSECFGCCSQCRHSFDSTYDFIDV